MRLILPLLLLVALPACGDDDPTGTEEPFEQTFTGTVDGGGWTSHTINPPRAGTLGAVLTWPDGTVDLDLYLTAASCTGYPPDDCTILDSSDAFTGTQESVQRTVSSGQQMKVWVDSWSEEASNYTIEVTID